MPLQMKVHKCIVQKHKYSESLIQLCQQGQKDISIKSHEMLKIVREKELILLALLSRRCVIMHRRGAQE